MWLLFFLGLAGLAASSTSGKSVPPKVASSFLKRRKEMDSDLAQDFQVPTWADGGVTPLPSDPEKYPNVILPAHLVPAWGRIIMQSVGLMAQVHWDKAYDAGDRPEADVDQWGRGKNLRWAAAYSADRATRDMLIFGVVAQGHVPEGQGGDAENEGRVTAEHIAAAAGTTGAALAAVAAGTVSTVVAGSVTTALTAVGVPAAVASTIGTATGTAAGAAAAVFGTAGAAVASALWPAAAMVAALAAIVGIAFGIAGTASGHTLRSYLVNGRPATPDVETAVASRDAGSRISSALDFISVMEVKLNDAWNKFYPNEAKLHAYPKLVANGQVEDQRALESWLADFLFYHWGLPWTADAANLYISQKKAGIAKEPYVHGFEWIGECEEADGSHQPSASTEGRRRVLAIFAGLGEKEAAWLAKKPGTRGPYPS